MGSTGEKSSEVVEKCAKVAQMVKTGNKDNSGSSSQCENIQLDKLCTVSTSKCVTIDIDQFNVLIDFDPVSLL